MTNFNPFPYKCHFRVIYQNEDKGLFFQLLSLYLEPFHPIKHTYTLKCCKIEEISRQFWQKQGILAPRPICGPTSLESL